MAASRPPVTDLQPIVECREARFARGACTALSQLSFSVRPGDRFLITGPVASGKSTLLRALAGRVRPDAGTVAYPSLTAAECASAIALIEFDTLHRERKLTSRYYQARYNSIERIDEPTIRELFGPLRADDEVLAALGRVRGEHLIHRPVIALSNGEVRRVLIARALAAHPALLLLDNPYVGLDAAARARMDDLIHELSEEGVAIVVTSPLPPSGTTFTAHVELGDVGTIPEAASNTASGAPSAPCGNPGSEPPLVFDCDNVSVVYENQTLLRPVDWTVRRGERWALLGPNGAGKSTLLSLLVGDNPYAYREAVSVFGRPRGSGESIWEIKARIGYVSPEVHLYFPPGLSGAAVVASGFSDSTVPKETLAATEKERVAGLLQALELSHLAERQFESLSTGEQRLLLIARGFVKEPEVLVLDEPFQGLDLGWIRVINSYLAASLRPNQTVILVTHFEHEIPSWVDKRLVLPPRNG